MCTENYELAQQEAVLFAKQHLARLHRILNVSSLLCQTLFLAWRRPGT